MRKDLYNNYDFCQTQEVYLQNREGNGHLPANTLSGSESDINASKNIPHVECPKNEIISHCAFTQYSLKQGLQLFPVEARNATMAEIQQLHNMEVFELVQKSSLTQQELMRTLSSITFIKQKRCGRIKARTCADGRPQRTIFEKWEAALPTVRTESVLFTYAVEERVIAVYDIPGAFLHTAQTDIVHIKMTGELVELLVEICPTSYTDYVIWENGKKSIFLCLKRALYGCLKSALLFWKHLSGNLIKRGY
jgi:hypothetical protein